MKRLLIILIVSSVLLSACNAPTSAPQTAVEDSASQADSRITELEKELKAKEEAIAKLQQQMQEQQRRLDALTPPPPSAPIIPATFVLGDLTITPTAVKTGEVVTIEISVSNTGGIEGSYTLVFQVERLGERTAEKNIEVTLKAGQTETVAFTTTVDVMPSIMWISPQATYTVNVNGKVGQFTVTEPPPTPEELEAKQVIEDLAYIKASVRNYSDDADPEPDGISLGISFYDSESRLISPSNVPLIVTIKLYYLGHPVADYQKDVRLLMYEDKLTINYSISQGIKIPFESLSVRSGNLTSFNQVEAQVTVTTPNQGDFSVTSTGIVDLN